MAATSLPVYQSLKIFMLYVGNLSVYKANKAKCSELVSYIVVFQNASMMQSKPNVELIEPHLKLEQLQGGSNNSYLTENIFVCFLKRQVIFRIFSWV